MIQVVIVSVPVPNETRSVFADWVELLILSGMDQVSERSLIRSMSIQAEPEQAVESRLGNEPVDEEIVETKSTQLSERVYEELAYREKALGELYPFELVSSFGNWMLVERAENKSASSAREAYITLLLISGLHSGILRLDQSDPVLIDSRSIMQIQAYLTASELIGGEAYWFGFPRPDGTGMLAAIKNLADRMGIGVSVSERPSGVPANEKDGTVDIVAWRGFRDKIPPIIVAYGQVAAGRNWESKPIRSQFDEKFLPWFSTPPSHHHLYLHFIPWIQHHKQRDEKEREFYQEAKSRAYHRERTLGVVLDRIRISELMLSAELSGRLNGADSALHLDRSRLWKENTLAQLTHMFA